VKRRLVFKILRYLGLAKIFKFLFQRDNITIILLHDIDKKRAEMTFSYLSKEYNIIDLNQYIEAHKKRDFSKIPKYAMIITFDDGHINNYQMLDAIKKYKTPVTIFLCASIINTKRHFWFMYNKLPISKSELKEKSNKERLEILKKYGFEQEKEFETPQALTKEQIEEMKAYVNMQSHTCFHPILPKCTYQEAKEEIEKSKEILEKEYNLNINAIAYPNGDYSNRDIKIAKEAGYECGITVDYGFNNQNSNIFKLKRISVNDTDDINELIVKASGLWAFLNTRNGKKQKYGYKESIKE